MATACSECGAPLKAGELQCWLCRVKHDEQSSQSVNPYASPQPIEPARVKYQFSLATLFLIMTLVAVAMGALIVMPGLGTLLIVFAVPALVRTVVVGRRRLEGGESPTVGTKILDFFVSVAIIWTVIIAAQIAFVVACTATGLPAAALFGLEEGAIYIGLGAGLAAAAVVATWMFYLTRPKSRVSST
jgi:hypothetical protein